VPSSICGRRCRRRSEGLFLLSLGGRVAFAVPRPAAARVFAVLASLLPLAAVASIIERIANAR